MPLTDDLEEQVGPLGAQRQVAELLTDNCLSESNKIFGHQFVSFKLGQSTYRFDFFAPQLCCLEFEHD
jgi:hypothetical protein